MRSSTRAALLAPLLLVLVGCAPIVALDPAEDAADPACAEVTVRLPEAIGEAERRETNAQATAAWGEPTGVILRCGVPAPAPTSTLPCVTVDGVDWLRDDTSDPNFVFTTYGRTPAIEVIIDSDGDPDTANDGVSGREALQELADAVGLLPVDGQCLALEDTETG